MDLKKLPWWSHDIAQKYKISNRFFEFVTNEELLIRIKNFPLTIDMINSFMDNYVSEVCLYDISNLKTKAKIYMVPPFNFGIMINKNHSLEKKASYLIHECAHGIYKVHGENCEIILDKCEFDFYNNNKQFCNNLFKKHTPQD